MVDENNAIPPKGSPPPSCSTPADTPILIASEIVRHRRDVRAAMAARLAPKRPLQILDLLTAPTLVQLLHQQCRIEIGRPLAVQAARADQVTAAGEIGYRIEFVPDHAVREQK